MASLEQVRHIRCCRDRRGFDRNAEARKRLARYPPFNLRIGFVQEFRPLSATQIRQLLRQCWTPPTVNLPQQPSAEDALRRRSAARPRGERGYPFLARLRQRLYVGKRDRALPLVGGHLLRDVASPTCHCLYFRKPLLQVAKGVWSDAACWP